jgi:Ca2+-binding EF-hand superfamily protein
MIAKIRNSIASSIFLKVISNMGFEGLEVEDVVSNYLKNLDMDGDGRVSYAEFMVKWKIGKIGIDSDEE